jgi:hypothetical protein
MAADRSRQQSIKVAIAITDATVTVRMTATARRQWQQQSTTSGSKSMGGSGHGNCGGVQQISLCSPNRQTCLVYRLLKNLLGHQNLPNCQDLPKDLDAKILAPEFPVVPRSS